uniref:Uncharacterized protein C1orf112 homolog isoform X2 n=1 Tax=Geotrypetes seraphini TaxID=260995 RepID=A0A6P8SHF5_GEOSA|nr:uncharacterized protein C1orf112 homolog isoform X2 [Geotrypetes seraphini]
MLKREPACRHGNGSANHSSARSAGRQVDSERADDGALFRSAPVEPAGGRRRGTSPGPSMSRAELLEEIGRWPPELSEAELQSAMPRLLSMYQCADSWPEHIRVLRILTQTVLPHIKFSELEENFFSQVLPKALKLFDDLMHELSSQATRLNSQNLELQATLRNILQNLIHGLEALTACVCHVSSLDEPLALHSIQTLPTAVLHILRNTFTHCKESELMYSGCLHLVSDLLQALFKEAVLLQKQLMELLDKINMDSTALEDDIIDMVSVLHTVLEICTVISSMDHALHANTWKFIIKQSLKHQSLVENQLRHRDIIGRLCDDILVSFLSCLQLAEQMKQSGMQENTELRLFQKTAKLCRFFANSLVHYTKEFMPFLSDSCSRIHQLYLQIHSKFPPSPSAPIISEEHKDELACVFLVVLDPLIRQLLLFRPFMELVLAEKLDLPSELLLPQCLLLISIMDKLPSMSEDVQSLWCTGICFPEETPRFSLFEALFFSFGQCYAELSLPVRLVDVVVHGQAATDVTVYQYVCVHLCALIAALPPVYFSQLERALLDAVLSANLITSVLAMDTWCFLARYGTAELCAQHVLIIAQLIKLCPGECYQLSHLSVLLRRMVFLMAADHQVEFINNHSPGEVENLVLWQHISLKAFTTELRKQVANDITTAVATVCQQWASNMYTLGDLIHLNASLAALLTVCSSAEEVMEPELQVVASEAIVQLWPLFHVKQVSDQPSLQHTLSLLLSLLGFFIHTLKPNLITQVLSLVLSLVQLEPLSHVHLATLDFLSCLRKLHIPAEMQSSILPVLSTLFYSLLSDSSWIIHHHALEAFTQFAEETSHEEAISQSLHSEEVKNKVILFLNKPSAKRPREEPDHDEKYSSEIYSMEAALQALHMLVPKGSPPHWLSQKLQELQTSLTSLQRHVQGLLPS